MFILFLPHRQNDVHSRGISGLYTRRPAHFDYTHLMRRLLLFIVFSILLFASACDLISDGISGATSPNVVTATPTTAVSVVQSTPDISEASTPTQTMRTLIVWVPPELTLTGEEEAGILSAQLNAFSVNYPDLELVFEQKLVSGQGSILNYLRTGRSVAPSILPDLVALPVEQLTPAAAEGLIFPLDGFLDPALIEDLYPAAQEMSRSEERVIGYPFALTNLPHLAYDSDVITGTFPLTWETLTTEARGGLIFPADGPDGAVLALEFYLLAGGSLVDEAGRPTLEVEPLAIALEQLSLGRSSGFILPQSNNVVTLDGAWQIFQNGPASLVQTTADQFLTSRTAEVSHAFGPIPGLDDYLVPLVDGWAWAVSAPEPEQQALAVELLTVLISDSNLGAWSMEHQLLPARRAAFEQWPVDDDPYVAFLQQEVARAQPDPLPTGSPTINVLSDAVYDVVSSLKTPQTAAEEAAAALQP